jgi:hypothetical protein
VVLGDVHVCDGERTLWRARVVAGDLPEQPVVVVDEALLVRVAVGEDDGLAHEAERHGAHAVGHRASDGLLGLAAQLRALDAEQGLIELGAELGSRRFLELRGGLAAQTVQLKEEGAGKCARVGREEEGTSSNRPELGGIVLVLQSAALSEDALLLCDNEAVLCVIKKWVGQGGKATLATATDADILREIVLGPSCSFIPLVLGPLNSLFFFLRGLGWRMRCGVKVTESSTNKQHSLSVPANATCASGESYFSDKGEVASWRTDQRAS